MTPLQLAARLETLRAALRTLVWGSAITWSAGATALVLAAVTLLRITTGGPSRVVAWVLAAVAAAAVLWWRVRVAPPARITALDAALWAESQAPDLRYALVTLAEQPSVRDADPLHARLAAFTTTTRWEGAVDAALRTRRTRTAGRLAGVLALLAVVAYPWAPRRALAGGAGSGPVAAAAAALAPGRVQASITLLPPTYTGRASRALEFGQTVTAIAGSVIRIDGAGARDRATLVVQESSDSGAAASRPVNVADRPEGWRGDVRVGAVPLALRLRDAVGERWLLVTPVADSAPVATLLLPAADTLVLDSTATIRVNGTVHDDIALRAARIEYIISSGSGEQFTFKSGVLTERKGGIGRDVTLGATIDLGALALKGGDLMHVRITAHDGNAVAGPSLGASETRTIRIPRADERDSVSVEQLPPTPVDKSVLSQRMLLMLTERLVARLPKLDRPAIVAESQRIGADQARLRKQVGDIVFARLGDSPSGEHAHFAGDGHEHTATDLAAQSTPESVLAAADRATGGVSGMLDSHGDETPVVAVNRPLLEAYNAMWDATRALQGAEPRAAIEPMRRAVAAIQRARSAERIYLRGTPPAAVVDIAKIRLTGTDTTHFEARRALDALPVPERRLAERVLRALALVSAADASAADSLRLIRLDALGPAPQLASALGAALDALDGRRDATEPLLRARRLAVAPWQRRDPSVLWTGGAP